MLKVQVKAYLCGKDMFFQDGLFHHDSLEIMVILSMGFSELLMQNAITSSQVTISRRLGQ